MIIALGITMAVIMPTLSLSRTLVAPGAEPWTVRIVDWVRDHGGGSIINTLENWYYSSHTGAERPPAPSDLPTVPPAPQGSSQGSTASRVDPQLPTLPLGPGLRRLRGEGQWHAGRRTADGDVAIWTSYFRPDSHYPGMLAGIAVLPRGRTVAHLVAGTAQAGAGQWPGAAAVPATAVPNLVATFNSGWRFRDAPGGFQIAGFADPRMINGLATAVITRSGGLDVRRWQGGSNTGVTAARQNLHLIVDHGAVVPGLSQNRAGLWGSAHNQFQYTERSGLGIDRYGNAIFIAGTHMNLRSLALAFREAGARRAMELDIHSSMTFFAQWQPTRTGHNAPTKLLPSMHRVATRYLKPDQRDFFYVTLSSAKEAQ